MINMTSPKIPQAYGPKALAGPLPISEEDLLSIRPASPAKPPSHAPRAAPAAVPCLPKGDQPFLSATRAALTSPRPSYVTALSEGALQVAQKPVTTRHRASTVPDYRAVGGAPVLGTMPPASSGRYFTSRLELAEPPRFYVMAMAAFVEKLRVYGYQLSHQQLQEVAKHHRALVALDSRHAQSSVQTAEVFALRREARDRTARMNEALLAGPQNEALVAEDDLAQSSPLVAHELRQLEGLADEAEDLEHQLLGLPELTPSIAGDFVAIRLALLTLRREALDAERQDVCSTPYLPLSESLRLAHQSPQDRQQKLVQIRALLAKIKACGPRRAPTLQDLLATCQAMLKDVRELGSLDTNRSNTAVHRLLPIIKSVTKDLKQLNDEVAAGHQKQPDAAHRLAMDERLAQQRRELEALAAKAPQAA